ncbi:MAG: right-handed parallel beta-helix repeat-containing protein [Phycisphaerae bacterium]|nr:right-handed parallel beta-helix repeat-containing protein [Phycisphaerae bacterium]
MRTDIRRNQRIALIALLALMTQVAGAGEFHVSVNGSDKNDGSSARPYKTISAAAQVAQPGDTVTVHEGTYRERVTPPRGGASDAQRIVYQAAAGEKVVIKGSEAIKGWQKVQDDTWKVVIPNSFFGAFNPYSDLIHGDWFNPKGRNHHTGAVYLKGHWLTEAAKLDEVLKPVGKTPLWFGEVDGTNTTIWAQFQGVNPNESEVEINVRRTVFYPAQAGINYLTVRGFTMRHAATPWAPPTAEQIGLLGTHWSKGWLIENNEIRYSTCVGIALGKYGDPWDNTSQNSAEGYVETINRALKNGWSKENIGHHVVRNNQISDCEQAGIVGSLGAVFCTITGNVIHDIHVRQLFTGAEMAGIKIHAAIDTEISHNHIYRTCRGIWLDWMAQGTRVTRNLLHDNNAAEDLFVEVDHGPFLVDNNLFLSGTSLLDMSEGGAYVHNLMTGRIVSRPEPGRETPYHPAHTTAVAGLSTIKGGDDRFYNNIIVAPSTEAAAKAASNPRAAAGYGLYVYDAREYPLLTGGNVYYNGAQPYAKEASPLTPAGIDPKCRLVAEGGGVFLHLTVGPELKQAATKLITTDLLGKTTVSKLGYENPDGSPLTVDTDYFGAKRNATTPCPGPFENPGQGDLQIKVW